MDYEIHLRQQARHLIEMADRPGWRDRAKLRLEELKALDSMYSVLPELGSPDSRVERGLNVKSQKTESRVERTVEMTAIQFDVTAAASSLDALSALAPPTAEVLHNVHVLRAMVLDADYTIKHLVRALRAEVEGPGPKQVGWLTHAGNVVTPVGRRKQDAIDYGWKPVYAFGGDAGGISESTDGMRAALERLLRAEEKYVRDTGLSQPDDLIQDAVNQARALLGWPAV